MPAPVLSRREFLKLAKVALVDLALLTVFGGGYARLVEPGWLQVTHPCLRLPRLPQAFAGLRMAQISDIHIGGWMDPERLARVVDRVLEENPDLVVITGDFAFGAYYYERFASDLAGMAGELRRLTASLPVFAVMGNHDHWSGVRMVRATLKESGVVELENRAHVLERDGQRLFLCGVDDHWEGLDRLDLLESALPEGACAVLLAHEPDFADLAAATSRFDLQLSGHSHGGQLVIPFIGPPYVPHLAKIYASGWYQVGGMQLYVNRGVGMIPPFIRFNCRPEITVFTLEMG